MRAGIWSRQRPLAILFFTLGSLILAWPWLSGAMTIPWDAKAHFYAQISFLAQALHNGESPFWNPYVFAGSPQIADPQSQIFSPPFLLLALLNSNPGFQSVDAVTFAMLWIAGVAVLCFSLDRGWHAAGALVTAFAFANGASAAWRIQHTGEVVSFCWFGVTLFLLGRAMDRKSVLYGLAAGVSAALMAIGRDQIAYLCALVLAGWVAWTICAGAGFRARLRALLPPLVVATCVGAIVVALPLALTIALAQESIRVDMGYAGAANGSLPPASFLTLMVANLFGVDGPLADYWGPPSPAIWGPNAIALARNMTDLYVGALPMIAIVAIGLGRGALERRAILFFTIAAIAMVLFALGDFTPLFRLAYRLPGMNLFRRPADATFPIGGLLAIVSGYCVSFFLRDRAPAQRSRLAAQIAAVLFLLSLCVFVAHDKHRLHQATAALALGFALFMAAGLTLALAKWLQPRSAALALFILAAMMTVDLRFSNGPNESTALPPSYYDVLRADTRNETIALLKRKLAETQTSDRRDRVEMAAVGFDWPNIGMIQRFDHWLGYNPIVLRTFAEATGAIDQVAIPEQRKFAPLFPRYRSVMADLLGVRWIATGVPAGELDKQWRPGDLVEVARTKDAYVYENPRALPRVMFASRAQAADFDAMLKSGVWPDVDYRATVLLENAPTEAASSATPGFAALISYHTAHIIVDADSDAGGYVVLNDVWHPWWRATVDGAAAPIERANVIFRAVKVPPGKRRVEFTFAPLTGLWRQMRALL